MTSMAGLPMALWLDEAAGWLPGSRRVGAEPGAITRVHTDSRTLRPGDLFVALRGEHFDGHDFLPQARAAGAVAAIAESGLAAAGLPGLEVPDTLRALQDLAAAWRARLDLKLIAVTGSNGKTTVTQMLAHILQAWQGEAALATAGNLNNHIGVPLMALRLRPGHRIAALELGMNHPGEIAQLAAIARPQVALVNNAQREHQEFMAGVEAVARENGSVFDALPADGCAVFPAGDPHTALWRGLAGRRRTLSFGPEGSGADLGGRAHWVPASPADGTAAPAEAAAAAGGHWAMQIDLPDGPCQARLHAAGRHNLHNAWAAAAAAWAAGVPREALAQGLARFRPVAGRSATTQRLWRGRRLSLVDDSYNANPDSVRAAIDLLASLPGPQWLVLGDMGEVGAEGPAFHAEVGAYARAAGLPQLWTAGVLAAGSAQAYGAGARHFADAASLAAALDAAPDCASVLVKGSRFMRMETVVDALRQRSAPVDGGPSAPGKA